MQTIFFPAGRVVRYLGELNSICLLPLNYIFLTCTLLEMVKQERKENQGFTGTGCCQEDGLYWNRCFENLWKPAERCQNVHNMNQQFTDILCEFGVVSGKFRRKPQQRLSALGTASQLNRQTLVCLITVCMMLSCRREDKGKKKDFLLLHLYSSLSWNHQIGKKDIIISS